LNKVNYFFACHIITCFLKSFGYVGIFIIAIRIFGVKVIFPAGQRFFCTLKAKIHYIIADFLYIVTNQIIILFEGLVNAIDNIYGIKIIE